MKLTKNIQILDLCLLIDTTLIISDAHFGFEEALNAEGTLIPRHQWNDTKTSLNKIFKHHKIEKVILNGDVKHAHGQIRETEWRYILKVVDLILQYAEVIIIQGNHDLFLAPIARKRNIHLVKEYKINDILIIHGDKIPAIEKNINTIIMGHEHPAITLRKGRRVEKYKCFLKGKYKKQTLIAMPSFNELTYGTDVLEETLLSPLLKNIDNFQIYAVGDKIYEFGTVKTVRKING